MSLRFEAGAPCWAGFRSADVSASASFYAGLFGWEGTASDNGYVVFSLHGAAVAGGGPLIRDGQSPAWCTYVKVDDADRSVRAAADGGASILIEPFDVPGQGRVGVITDPGGAELWIWQPLGFEGVDRLGEPGTICGQALLATDPEAAREFYRAAFGDAAASRCRDRADSDGAEPDDDWLVTFGAEDVAAIVERALGLGATADLLGQGWAELIDPQGCRFAVGPASGA